MKNVKQWVFILIALVMIVAAVLLIVWSKNGDGNGEKITEKTEVFTGELKELIFQAGACEVEMKEGPAGQITVQYENIELKSSESGFSDGVLTIKTKDPKKVNFFGLGFSVDSEDAKITVTIPADTVLEKATLEFGAAEVTAERISAEELTIAVGAGEFTAEQLVAETSARLTVGAGAFYAEEVHLTNAELECGVGEMELSGVIYGDATVDCGVGALELTLDGQTKEEFRGELSCGLGKLCFGDITINGSGEETYGSSEAENRMNVKCGIGEVNVRFE